jgi:hypothetical protein
VLAKLRSTAQAGITKDTQLVKKNVDCRLSYDSFLAHALLNGDSAALPSAKLVHQSRCQYNITKSMRQEIEFFRKKLLPTSKICWESSIAHIIPRIPTFTT